MPATFKVGDLVRSKPNKYPAWCLRHHGKNPEAIGIIRSKNHIHAGMEAFFFELRGIVYLYAEEIEKVEVDAG